MARRYNYKTGKWEETSQKKIDYEHLRQLAEVRRLQAQNDRSRLRLAYFGEDAPKEGGSPSILSRTFDVLSRPLYGVAEGTKRAIKGEDLGDVLEGVVGGVAGKNKTTFSDVLDEAGMPGGWQRTALGFGLDVALDPTTYLGVGLVGKIDDVGKVGVQAFKSSQKAVKAERLLGKTGSSKVINDALTEARTLAAARGTTLTAKEAKEVSEEALLKYGNAIAKVESDAAKAKRARVGLKFAGRTVGTSETLGRVFGRRPDRVSGTALGHWFDNAFRTSRRYPGEMRAIKTANESEEIAMLEDALKFDIRRPFTGTSPQRRKEITEYIRNGMVHHLDPDDAELARKAQDVFRRIADEEWGVFGWKHMEPGKLNPNYVPENIYRKGGQMKKFKSAKEAAKHGYAPVEDIADLLAYKLVEHHKLRAQFAISGQLADQFGIHLSGRGSGFAKRMADDQLLEPVKGHRFLPDNVYFDPEIADAIRKMETVLTHDESASQLMHLFDKVLNQWKFMVTAPNPGFHMRNIMGDMWNNFLDGVVDPRIYNKAKRVVFARNMGDPKRSILRLSNRRALTKDEIWQLYQGNGLRSGFFRADVDVIPTGMTKTSRRASDAMRSVSEKREDFARMAHFMDALQKEYKSAANLPTHLRLNEAAKKAAERVRKFNFDYNDFTPFERNTMKRVIPFYSWMRKNVPLQLESLWARPGRLLVAPKGMSAVQELLGTKGQEPLPGLGFDSGILQPQWMRDASAMLLRQGDGSSNPLMLLPEMPFQDIGRYVEGLDSGDYMHPLKEILGATNPMLRAPFELATQRNIFSGAPIESNKDYLINQLPLGRFVTDQSKEAEKRPDSAVTISLGGQEVNVSQRVLNWLTGLGLYQITPNMMKGELRRQQDPLQSLISEARKARERRG